MVTEGGAVLAYNQNAQLGGFIVVPWCLFTSFCMVSTTYDALAERQKMIGCLHRRWSDAPRVMYTYTVFTSDNFQLPSQKRRLHICVFQDRKAPQEHVREETVLSPFQP